MPIEQVVTKSEWEADKFIPPIEEKIAPEIGVYSTGKRTATHTFKKPIRKVAVIGAGPAGLPTAKHLLDEGIQVKIYERNTHSGGTWIYHKDEPLNPTFPSEVPTKIIQPSLPPENQALPTTIEKSILEAKDELLKLNPPTPCYKSLRNNVATPLLKYDDFSWPQDTPWFTTHHVICKYLQDYSRHFNLDQITEYLTSVEKLEELPDGQGWKVLTKSVNVNSANDKVQFHWKEEVFDAVVVATGHYHAPYVPDIPGLSQWREKWGENVIHSKRYRTPEQFKQKSVLLIGNGTSAIDISRDISPHVKTIYQSVRKSHHAFDEKYLQLRQEISKFIPEKVKRVENIKQFRINPKSDNIQDAVVELEDGTEITGLDYIIVCTGYVFSFHFLEDLHSDEATGEHVDDQHVLVKDGTQVFNLHKDIFYIPNPTLSFVGIPFHIATFSLFEYQSYAVSRVYSNSATLPRDHDMREEWHERLRQKGPGREFHALGSELELAYIRDIVTWINNDGEPFNKKLIKEHDDEWIDIKNNGLTALKKALNIN